MCELSGLWGATVCRAGECLLAQNDVVSPSLLERLAPTERLRVFMALLAIVLLGVLSVWLIRMTGRLTRWYAGNVPLRRPPPKVPNVDDWTSKPLQPPMADDDDATHQTT